MTEMIRNEVNMGQDRSGLHSRQTKVSEAETIRACEEKVADEPIRRCERLVVIEIERDRGRSKKIGGK